MKRTLLLSLLLTGCTVVMTNQPASFNAKKTFGAVGDGVADDTAALQAGINAASSNGVLFIPEGTYKVRTLKIPSNLWPINPVLSSDAGTHIRGAGMSKTKLICSGPVGLDLTGTSGYQSVYISDLSVTGPGSGTGIGIGALQGWDGQQLGISSCGIIGWDEGLAVTNIWGFYVQGCTISSNKVYGIKFIDTHDISVSGTIIKGGFNTYAGTGVAFIGPLNFGIGDNAKLDTVDLSYCTNAIVNAELNLICANVHCERCGKYYSTPAGAPTSSMLTWIGGYILDLQDNPLASNYPSLFDVPTLYRPQVQVINPLFQSNRPTF